ncbi:MAG: leucine-rich repeat domain-containing protein [Verrucomicrobiota bacterium]
MKVNLTLIQILVLAAMLLALPIAVQAQYTFTTNSDGSLNISAYTGSGGAVVIPATTNGLTITSIGGDSFQGCTNLTSVTIPNTVTSIGAFAFDKCYSLSAIMVSASNLDYSSLGGALFNKSQTFLIQYPIGNAATNYSIPDSVTTIGDVAFDSCSRLANVTIPDSVTTIGEFSFQFCTNLTSVMIPNSVTSIGQGVFYICSSLTSVTISTNLTSIGMYAFAGCASLTSVTIPNSVTSIGDFAFISCSSLTAITVSASNPDYSSLDGILFNQNQTTLIEYPAGLVGGYIIPNSVNNIADSAFIDCSNLTGVTIPNSVTTIEAYAFASCISLTNVTIPNSATIIGEDAFQNCANLTSVMIPDSITFIGQGLFYGCISLTSVTIPNSVTSIEEDALYGCSSLTNITFMGDAPALVDTNEFLDDGVAAKTVYYYHGTSGWSSTYGGLPTVELFKPPQISGVGDNVGTPSGNFIFTVTGVSGQTIVVDASTNLVNWQPVWTNTLTGTNALFTDPQWKNYPSRFYRAQ